jgi:hypothetical protein
MFVLCVVALRREDWLGLVRLVCLLICVRPDGLSHLVLGLQSLVLGLLHGISPRHL